ncbi:MAG: zinc ribbon domain-containing protein [Phycisphaerae bacterium]|nr:zinc ribbon domain-containing protein [Phycisphaerae bacterium]
MPTYEYECQQCGNRFERFQSMKDSPLTTCPACNGKLKRLIGAGGAVIFKGSGFYATEYGRSNTRCGQERPCCGRDTACERPPCSE